MQPWQVFLPGNGKLTWQPGSGSAVAASSACCASGVCGDYDVLAIDRVEIGPEGHHDGAKKCQIQPRPATDRVTRAVSCMLAVGMEFGNGPEPPLMNHRYGALD